MASVYWFGGTGNWSDHTNHWSNNSGNSPVSLHGSVPGNDDNVIFDSASHNDSYVVTTDIPANCLNLTCDNPSSGILTIERGVYNFVLNVFGSLYLASNMIMDRGIVLEATSTGKTITTNGVSLEYLRMDGNGGGWELQDNLNIDGYLGFLHYSGIFDLNDNNINTPSVNIGASSGSVPTLIMGSGIITTHYWEIEEEDGESVTITPETSTIQSGGTFYGGGKTYYNIEFGNYYINSYVYGSNTFNNIKINAGYNLNCEEGTTQIASTFTAVGSPDNIIELNSENTIDQFNLSCPSGNIITDYLNISNCNATGGARWIANHSVDIINNDGWIFNFPFPTHYRT